MLAISRSRSVSHEHVDGDFGRTAWVSDFGLPRPSDRLTEVGQHGKDNGCTTLN